MKNYQDNDYALNRYSEGIVYRFVDGSTITVTLAKYLAENPDKTEADFRALKELSDCDYLQVDRSESRQDRKVSLQSEWSAALRYAPAADAVFFDGIDAREDEELRARQVQAVRNALGTLTDTQRRRCLLYHIYGMTTRAIADVEGVTHQSVAECLRASEKKICKFLENH